MPTNRSTVPRTTAALKIPFEPAQGGWYTGAEHDAIRMVVSGSESWRTGWRGSEYVTSFEEAFAQYTGASHALAFNSGGTAMEMVLRALELKPGDEVISCAINFVGPHIAVIGQGGRLVLAEPDPLTLNLDLADTEQRIGPQTRAILVTHWNGASADIDRFVELAARHPHPVHGPPVVIVDAARACGGRTSSGARVGAEGWATVFSFESKKLMTTFGQGGIVTTGDQVLAERLRGLRTYGGRAGWGTNQLLSKAQAAVGLIQLARLDEMNAARITRAHERTAALADIPELTLPPTLDEDLHLYYRHNLLVPEAWAGRGRDELMDVLADRYGVGSIISDPVTYLGHDLIRAHTAGQHCPRAEQLAARLLCPCLHPQMTRDEEAQVRDAIRRAMASIAQLHPATAEENG
ncbi:MULTISPECIES: DegT/DnrJ/EryC1/StrS aminotransferase family protein [Streptomyces]|uniref:DegT/DnrJ/EryC1/StrS family aminotransferase n=1 Tax=Streptomyces TaxID=1883 RepID=UPI00093DA488|nr:MULTISPECIES: DegT/DnrJ/EryC1/StrS family aminotransferase [unclassified Streptomyces]OKJ09994.1 DegT/DnrJ/EryC1/StrS aminotransferase [Streptomyces sp. TSRI0261]OWA26336.1 DegT/DnrJ/EryC1/StrS aminotransferase [Streptomyces sp. CS057]QNQ38552.1 aminotransferase class V-fold PLP-dependent enzyme [Streptomyces sp. CB00271]